MRDGRPRRAAFYLCTTPDTVDFTGARTDATGLDGAEEVDALEDPPPVSLAPTLLREPAPGEVPESEPADWLPEDPPDVTDPVELLELAERVEPAPPVTPETADPAAPLIPEVTVLTVFLTPEVVVLTALFTPPRVDFKPLVTPPRAECRVCVAPETVPSTLPSSPDCAEAVVTLIELAADGLFAGPVDEVPEELGASRLPWAVAEGTRTCTGARTTPAGPIVRNRATADLADAVVADLGQPVAGRAAVVVIDFVVAPLGLTIAAASVAEEPEEWG